LRVQRVLLQRARSPDAQTWVLAVPRGFQLRFAAERTIPTPMARVWSQKRPVESRMRPLAIPICNPAFCRSRTCTIYSATAVNWVRALLFTLDRLASGSAYRGLPQMSNGFRTLSDSNRW